MNKVLTVLGSAWRFARPKGLPHLTEGSMSVSASATGRTARATKVERASTICCTQNTSHQR